MNFNPQEIINSRLGVGTALLLGRVVPPGVGYRIARTLARKVANRRDWEMIRVMRANQWVVGNGNLSDEQLDQAVQETLNYSAQAIYDMYHYGHDPEATKRLTVVSEKVTQLYEEVSDNQIGTVVVGMHLCGFDLGLREAMRRGFKPLALTFPQVSGGYEWQYNMRVRSGVEIVQATHRGVRKAIERLRAGGIVLVALDRPIENAKYRPRFFNRPASIPVQYVYLALKTGAPVCVASVVILPDGTYQFIVSDLIHLKPHPDRHTEMVTNAEAILRLAEDVISKVPHQWAMYYPVWPEVVDQIS
jgi:lauroyl/myristoyl acyltransferase